VTSFGPASTEVAKGAWAQLLQVRMTVNNNNGHGPWIVDTRQQLADVPGQGQTKPVYVNAGAAKSAIITIPPGGQQVLDLYFALPPHMTPQQLAGYSVLWTVQTTERTVSERTGFTRVPLEPPQPAYYPSVALGLGWGPFWWYDPFYPTVTFVNPMVVHQPYPVVVHSPRYISPAPAAAHPVAPAQQSAPVERGAPTDEHVAPPAPEPEPAAPAEKAPAPPEH
jgi:hypothetical protein